MMFQPKSNDLFGLKRLPPINKTCTIDSVSIVLMNDRASSMIAMLTRTCCSLSSNKTHSLRTSCSRNRSGVHLIYSYPNAQRRQSRVWQYWRVC